MATLRINIRTVNHLDDGSEYQEIVWSRQLSDAELGGDLQEAVDAEARGVANHVLGRRGRVLMEFIHGR